MLKLSPNPRGIRLLLNPELEELRALHPDLPMPQNCITCGGAKTFRWRAPDDPNRIEDYECDCMAQWALYVYLLHCGIEKAYQWLAWADVQGDPEAVATVRDYMDGADRFVKAGVGLILYGDRGTGKTLLTTLLLKHILALGIEGYFVPMQEMISAFMEGFRNQEKADRFRRRVRNAPVLVIDDVGKDYLKRTTDTGTEVRDFATSTVGRAFDSLLRHRMAAAKPTIFTTNYELEELKQAYGGDVFGLVEERAVTWRVKGDNFRPASMERMKFEVKNRLTRPIVIG